MLPTDLVETEIDRTSLWTGIERKFQSGMKVWMHGNGGTTRATDLTGGVRRGGLGVTKSSGGISKETIVKT